MKRYPGTAYRGGQRRPAPKAAAAGGLSLPGTSPVGLPGRKPGSFSNYQGHKLPANDMSRFASRFGGRGLARFIPYLGWVLVAWEAWDFWRHTAGGKWGMHAMGYTKTLDCGRANDFVSNASFSFCSGATSTSATLWDGVSRPAILGIWDGLPAPGGAKISERWSRVGANRPRVLPNPQWDPWPEDLPDPGVQPWPVPLPPPMPQPGGQPSAPPVTNPDGSPVPRPDVWPSPHFPPWPAPGPAPVAPPVPVPVPPPTLSPEPFPPPVVVHPSPRPGMPPVVRPGRRRRGHPRPPRPRERERKGRGRPAALQWIMRAVHATTEAGDVIDAIWMALPRELQSGPRRVGVRQWVAPGLAQKGKDIWDHYDSIDLNQAMKNILANHLEDILIGLVGRQVRKANINLGELGLFGDMNLGGIARGPAL